MNGENRNHNYDLVLMEKEEKLEKIRDYLVDEYDDYASEAFQDNVKNMALYHKVSNINQMVQENDGLLYDDTYYQEYEKYVQKLNGLYDPDESELHFQVVSIATILSAEYPAQFLSMDAIYRKACIDTVINCPDMEWEHVKDLLFQTSMLQDIDVSSVEYGGKRLAALKSEIRHHVMEQTYDMELASQKKK